MPRKKQVEIEVEEATTEEIAPTDRRTPLEDRLMGLRSLRALMESEGVDSISKLDALTAKVIQEIGTL